VLRVLGGVALALFCGAVAGAAAATGASVACPTRVSSVEGTSANIGSLMQTVGRTVPQVYSSMTNQAGRGAWRGYVVREIVSLDETFPLTPERTRSRAAAAARCGGRIAAASWTVRLGFPNAGSIPSSHSTAWFVHTASGWRFWFRLP
jgi:hypothetical protein